MLCGFSKYLKNTYIPSSFYKFSNLLGIISNLFFFFKFDNQVILRCYGLCDFAGGFITSSILDCLVRSFFRVWELISFSNFVAYGCNIFAWHLVSFLFCYVDIDHFIKLWPLFLYSLRFFEKKINSFFTPSVGSRIDLLYWLLELRNMLYGDCFPSLLLWTS